MTGADPVGDTMDDQPTCGKGLAAHSTLPAKLAEVTGAVADVLEAHMAALDLADPNAKREYDAYRELVDAHRLTAAQLEATARRMAAYRDLPMGAHDMAVMMSARSADTFARLVAAEEELAELMRTRLDEHRAMLGEMNASGESR
jgi:hypothetical protein